MSETEHRCGRCGRRPNDLLTEGALATLPRPVGYEPEPPPVDMTRAVQTSFAYLRPAANVVAFEEYAPAPAKPRVKRQSSAAPRRAHVSPDQTELDLMPAEPPKPRTLPTTVEAVIYCDAPVAVPVHRAIAAAFDWGLVLTGYGLFLLVFHLMGGHFGLDRMSLLTMAGMLAVMGVGYSALWAAANIDTPGMRWAQLKLTTFDGQVPELNNRLLRLGGGCLSFCTVLGMAWSLADEESLTWADHISSTFPTAAQLDSMVFRRH
jgi:hypothetical protein